MLCRDRCFAIQDITANWSSGMLASVTPPLGSNERVSKIYRVSLDRRLTFLLSGALAPFLHKSK